MVHRIKTNFSNYDKKDKVNTPFSNDQTTEQSKSLDILTSQKNIFSAKQKRPLREDYRFSIGLGFGNKNVKKNFKGNPYTTFSPICGSINELIAYIKKGFAVSPSTFKNNYRELKNVLNTGVWLGDIDKDFTIDQCLAIPFVKKYCFIYTSPSHTEENHRFRIILPLPCEVDSFTYQVIGEILNELLNGKLDPAPLHPASILYGNTNAQFFNVENISGLDYQWLSEIESLAAEKRTKFGLKKTERIKLGQEHSLANLEEIDGEKTQASAVGSPKWREHAFAQRTVSIELINELPPRQRGSNQYPQLLRGIWGLCSLWTVESGLEFGSVEFYNALDELADLIENSPARSDKSQKWDVTKIIKDYNPNRSNNCGKNITSASFFDLVKDSINKEYWSFGDESSFDGENLIVSGHNSHDVNNFLIDDSRYQNLSKEDFENECQKLDEREFSDFQNWLIAKVNGVSKAFKRGFKSHSELIIPKLNPDELVYDPSMPLPSPYDYPDGTIPSFKVPRKYVGHKAKIKAQLLGLGWSIHDSSFMGEGKSHDTAKLDKIIYADNNYKNPSIEDIKKMPLMPPRTITGLYEVEGKIIADPKPEIAKKAVKIADGNCRLKPLFRVLSDKAFDVEGTKGICEKCPNLKTCSIVSEDGTTLGFRGGRKQAIARMLKDGRGRAHSAQLTPDMFTEKGVFEDFTIVFEEASKIELTKKVGFTTEMIDRAISKIALLKVDAKVNFQILEEKIAKEYFPKRDVVIEFLGKIKELLTNAYEVHKQANKGNKFYGLNHETIINYLGDIPELTENEVLILQEAFEINLDELIPDFVGISQDGIGNDKDLKAKIRNAERYLKDEQRTDSFQKLNNQDSNWFNWLLDVLYFNNNNQLNSDSQLNNNDHINSDNQYNKFSNNKNQFNNYKSNNNGRFNIVKKSTFETVFDSITGENKRELKTWLEFEITKLNSHHIELSNSAKSVLLLDATATTKHLKAKYRLNKPLINIYSELPTLKNLKVINIGMSGMRSNDWSQNLLERLNILKQDLLAKHGDNLAILSPKKFTKDLDTNYYFGRDDRGTNELVKYKVIAHFGSPKPNVRDMQLEHYFLYKEDNSYSFEDFYKETIQEQQLQATGRSRVQHFPEKTFTHYFVGTDQDMSFLERYGIHVENINIADFCINASSKGDKTKATIFQTAKGLIEDGVKLTQEAIAQYANISQQLVSKVFKGSTLGWRKFKFLLLNLYKVHKEKVVKKKEEQDLLKIWLDHEDINILEVFVQKVIDDGIDGLIEISHCMNASVYSCYRLLWLIAPIFDFKLEKMRTALLCFWHQPPQ